MKNHKKRTKKLGCKNQVCGKNQLFGKTFKLHLFYVSSGIQGSETEISEFKSKRLVIGTVYLIFKKYSNNMRMPEKCRTTRTSLIIT